jgi:hypothetical protein
MAGSADSRPFNLAYGTVPGGTFLGTVADHVSNPPNCADPFAAQRRRVRTAFNVPGTIRRSTPVAAKLGTNRP